MNSFFAVLECYKSIVRTTYYHMKHYHTIFICHAKQTTKDSVQLLNKAFCHEKQKENKTKKNKAKKNNKTQQNKQFKNVYIWT